MKLETNQRNVETSGIQESNRFTIEMNSAAVDILSSKIYTNNYLAIVRELTCNAWDAHVAAGTTDTPFDVIFPSTLKSDFQVRDYGTGLSHDNVMYLYTTYFGSDKRNSNDAIGGLGLGSKAPFAYTDAFSVRSFYKGTVRTYAIYRDADNLPKCDLMDTSLTTLPNGLEVTVPVRIEDGYHFRKVANQALQWFPVKPNVSGETITDVEWELKTKTCGLLKDDSRYGDARALMGSVVYNIDRSQVEDNEFIKLSSVASALLRDSNFVLFANIGDLSISASREELNYTKSTLKHLVTLLERAATEITNEISTRLKGEDRIAVRFYERAKLPKAMRNILSVDSDVMPPADVTIRAADSSTWHRLNGFATISTHSVTLRHNKHPNIIIDDVAKSPYRKVIMANKELQPDKITTHGWSRKYSQADKDVYILTSDDWNHADVKEFMRQFDPNFVFKISDYYTKPVAGKVGGGVRTPYVNPKERERELGFNDTVPRGRSKYNWNKFTTKLSDLDPEETILVGVNGSQAWNHDADKEFSWKEIDVANRLINGQRFVAINKAIWKTAKKLGVPTLQEWLPKAVQEYVGSLTHEQYLKEKYPSEVRNRVPILYKFISHSNVWKNHAPDSLVHMICTEHDGVFNSTQGSVILDIEAYLGRKLFTANEQDLDEYMPRLHGADEWLRATYPELAKYLTESSWVRVDEMTAHYVNLKEGLYEDEC